uniref:Proline dehydrogenase n=1 Tax=Elaeophora elaphi TaxID=1147741 RepID=A0A0R3RXQ3_9BILA
MPTILLRPNSFTLLSNFRSVMPHQSYRMASSEKQSHASVVNIDEIKECYSKLDLDFKSTKTAFRGKKTSELFRSLIVLPLCTVQAIRGREELLMVGLKKVFGEKLYAKLLKLTFFGQFVGGETISEVQETMIRLKKYGVKSILDYCVESDISSDEAERKAVEGIVGGETRIEAVENIVDKATVEKTRQRYTVHKEFGDRRKDVVSARTYFYESEVQCDKNCDIFCASVNAITSAVGNCGINCIKLTALGRPQLLLKLSELIAQSNNFYKILTGSSWEDLLLNKIKKEEFLKRIQDHGVQIDEAMMQKWLKTVDFGEDGFVDFYDWRKLIDEHKRLDQMFQVYNIKTKKMEPLLNCLTSAESQETVNMMDRIARTIEYGKKHNLRTMIDAEQTYFQPAISRLAIAMMRKYNKENALVFNTYQAYLKSCLRDIELDLLLARREGFHFGCKVVRGAYVEQERKRAAALNYDDPINPNIETTAETYKRVVQRIIRECQERSPGSISVMVATHNEQSIKDVIEMMCEANISPSSETVSFAQLYGMCDQVSYSLGNAGYSVYKYVPYGPIDKVLPYLSRRAQENASVLGKIRREVNLMFRELVRRTFTLSGRFG